MTNNLYSGILKNRTWVLSFLICQFFVAVVSLAQGERPTDPEYLAQGHLLILRVVPHENTAKLFFAGHKFAHIDFQKDHKVLEITAFKANEREELQFSKQGDSYLVPHLPDWSQPYDLVVKSATKGKIENLRVHLPNTKP